MEIVSYWGTKPGARDAVVEPPRSLVQYLAVCSDPGACFRQWWRVGPTQPASGNYWTKDRKEKATLPDCG